MSTQIKLPDALMGQMREAQFELAADQTLVYLDPAIGPLANRRRGLAIRLNRKRTRFELVEHGSVTDAVDLQPDVVRACEQAFGMYFTAYERACRMGDAEPLAA